MKHLKRVQETSKGIVLKIGIEIDVSKIYGTDPSKLPFDVLNGFDYILFEYVGTEYESWGQVGTRDISEVVRIRKKLRIPVGLAHNDIQQNYDEEEEQITTILADNDIFIELNQSKFGGVIGRNTRKGLDYYHHFSDELLEQLVKKDVRVVCGTDSHDCKNLGELEDVYRFVKENNLSYHSLVNYVFNLRTRLC